MRNVVLWARCAIIRFISGIVQITILIEVNNAQLALGLFVSFSLLSFRLIIVNIHFHSLPVTDHYLSRLVIVLYPIPRGVV